jgi:hypothetical protein
MQKLGHRVSHGVGRPVAPGQPPRALGCPPPRESEDAEESRQPGGVKQQDGYACGCPAEEAASVPRDRQPNQCEQRVGDGYQKPEMVQVHARCHRDDVDYPCRPPHATVFLGRNAEPRPQYLRQHPDAKQAGRKEPSVHPRFLSIPHLKRARGHHQRRAQSSRVSPAPAQVQQQPVGERHRQYARPE